MGKRLMEKTKNKETAKDRLIRALHLQLQSLIGIEEEVELSDSAEQFLARPNDFRIEVHIHDKTGQVPLLGTSWSIN